MLSGQRKFRNYLRQLAETRGILEAMKNLAAVELHKLGRRLEYQQRMVEDLEAMARDFLDFYHYTTSVQDDRPYILVLFGSERGFCGDFNESLLTDLKAMIKTLPGKRLLPVAVGSKLGQRMEGDPGAARIIEGADVTEEVPRVLDRILSGISDVQKRYGPCNMYTLYHHADTGEVKSRQLLPPFRKTGRGGTGYTTPPLLNVPPGELISALVDHYLFTALHETAYTSLVAENYSRVQHMTAALDRLDEQSSDVTRRYHIFRQEEITEEIEVILLNASELSA